MLWGDANRNIAARTSRDAANSQIVAVILTVQANTGIARLLVENNPIHAKLLMQPLKIGGLKVTPALQSLYLPLPGFRQNWKHGDCAAVFHIIRQAGTFRDGAKTLNVFRRRLHVLGIEHEVGVVGRVIANPEKCVYPGIAGICARPFDMRASRKQLQLRKKHSRAERNKKRAPKQDISLEDEFRQQPSGKNKQQHVEKMQAAHGLQFRKIGKGG